MDLTELPKCTVCLERMDESVNGILTTLCNHSFHSQCLQRWDDTTWVQELLSHPIKAHNYPEFKSATTKNEPFQVFDFLNLGSTIVMRSHGRAFHFSSLSSVHMGTNILRPSPLVCWFWILVEFPKAAWVTVSFQEPENENNNKNSLALKLSYYNEI